MKTTFKKTIAAISAAAVVAASAAVFAVPADAAGSAAIGNVSVTLDELKANSYQVVVPVTVSGSGGWYELGFGASFDRSKIVCKAIKSGPTIGDAMLNKGYAVAPGTAINPNEGFIWAGYAVTPDGVTKEKYTVDDGVATNLTFEVQAAELEKDLAASKTGSVTYTITALSENGNYKGALSTKADGDQPISISNGSITITAPVQTTATTVATTTTTKATTTTTTKATTTTTTKATTTTTKATTTTTKATTTTTTASTTAAATTTTAKKGGTTSSPQTSDVLPIAGAAAALVVIGGVALVAKKRK